MITRFHNVILTVDNLHELRQGLSGYLFAEVERFDYRMVGNLNQMEICMPVKIDLSGLKRLTENAKALDGTTEVPFLEIMSPEFISSVSRFDDFDCFAKGAGYTVLTADDLKAIPDEPWDDFIRRETSFESWIEMQKAGAAEYVKRKLLSGLGR